MLDEQVLAVLERSPGTWMDAVDVARAVRRNVYDGVVQALDRLVEQKLALRHGDFTWRYCITQRGLRAVGERARQDEGEVSS